MSASEKLDSVQCLRGFAAMSVFFFHNNFGFPLWSDNATNAVSRFIGNGYLGVDVFFVISGFILAWVSVLGKKSGATSPIEFGIKRFFRVAPAYWASMAVMGYIFAIDAPPEKLFQMFAFYPLGDQIPPYLSQNINPVGWTLNYEMAFYLIFGVSLVFGRFALAVASLSIVALVFAVPLLMGYPITVTPGATLIPFEIRYLKLITNPIMLEFVLGILCAWLFSTLKYRVGSLQAVMLSFIGGALLFATYCSSERGFSVIRAGIPSAILLLGLLLTEARGIIRFPRFVVMLGDLSFAVYLTHWTIHMLFYDHMKPATGIAPYYGQTIVITAVGLTVAFYWKRFIEDPSATFGNHLAMKYRTSTQALSQIRPKRVEY